MKNIKEKEIVNDNDSFVSKIEVKKEEKLNFTFKSNENKKEDNVESISSNENLMIIEELENENENDKDKDKFMEINSKETERYGVLIKEIVYKVKEGNYHIIEEETKKDNFDFLGKF